MAKRFCQRILLVEKDSKTLLFVGGGWPCTTYFENVAYSGIK